MCPPPQPPPPAAAPPRGPPPPPPHHPPEVAGGPPPPYPYPYPYYGRRRSKSSSGCASCMLATLFLAAVIAAGLITCFVLFRPLDPEIAVSVVKFPAFSLDGSRTAANFTFFQYAAVRNPNRYDFSHYDSSLQLASAATGPVGSVYIPAGRILPGRTQYVSATFDVRSFPVPPPLATAAATPGTAAMELETRMKLVGTVKVLKVFAHHVEKGATCRVTVQVSDGTVLGFNC